MAAHLFYPRPFEFLLTDDGTPTGNSNFVGDYVPTHADAYFAAEDFDYSHFAVTGFKVQLSHGPYMDGYGKLATGLNALKLFYEADSVPREFLPYVGSELLINNNTGLRYACGAKNVPFAYEEFADVRTYHCNFMRHGKPFIFPVLQGAKFGFEIHGDISVEPTFTLHRFVVTGFHTSAPEYWSI